MDLIGGRFELREPIASGGTSTVWRAFDHELGTVCAAKVLRMRDAGGLMRFAREQSRRLEGHHIVTPYAWVADDGTALIAFELLPGGSLRTLIGDYGPLADATIVAILDQLLDALEGVHGAGIVHRDVKPGNVLLRATGDGPIDVALADFGIAIAFTDARLTIAGTVIGTPGYMPPEVLRGEAVPEDSHDLFALGRVAAALVLGHENGTSEEATELIEDPVLARALRALTASDPQLRPSNVQEAQQLLAGAVRDALPRDRDGELITVFDQIGEEPEPSKETTPMFHPSRPTLEQSGTTPAVPSEVDRAIKLDEPTKLDRTITPEKSAESNDVRGTGDSGGIVPRPGKPLSSRWIRLTIAAVALAVTGIISFVIWNGSREGDPLIPTDGVTATVEPGDTPSDTGQPNDTGKATSTPEGPKENAPNVGDTCTWLTEGDLELSQSGAQVQCQLVDGEYLWQVP